MIALHAACLALSAAMLATSFDAHTSRWTAPVVLAPRERADVLSAGQWSLALSSPTRVGLHHRRELSAQGLGWLIAMPNIGWRQALLAPQRRWQVRAEVGVALPTLTMRLLRGYLFPLNLQSGDKPGWTIVPRFGLAVSYGHTQVIAGKVEVASALPLDGSPRLSSLDTYAPVELLFAPVTDLLRIHLALLGDLSIHRRMRVRPALHLWIVGPLASDRSPVIVDTRVAFDVAATSRLFFSVGAVWFNSDQHRQRLVVDASGIATRHRVRSNDFYPTLDVVWCSH